MYKRFSAQPNDQAHLRGLAAEQMPPRSMPIRPPRKTAL